MQRSTSVVLIERFQYQLVDPQGLVGNLEAGPGDGFGLLDPHPFLIVRTGTPWGALRLTVEVDEAAPELDLEPWEDVAEISVRSPSGVLAFATCESGLTDGTPEISMAPLTGCRVRVHARGRDIGNQYVDSVPEPVEEHLVQIWPAEPTATEAHKLTDALGQRARSRST